MFLRQKAKKQNKTKKQKTNLKTNGAEQILAMLLDGLKRNAYQEVTTPKLAVLNQR